MQKISILGCGWLGFSLAKKLIECQYEVFGSTTTLSKIQVLADAKIMPFLLTVSENAVHGDINSFLDKIDVLIIDIPPKLRRENQENFVQKIENLIPYIENSTVTKVVFISSTSVFADDNTIVNQYAIPNPDSESGRQLYYVEKLLQHNINFETTVVRFGGLVGIDRHPAKIIAGKTDVQNPTAPINLIHQDDCISIIIKIIENQAWNQTFNAVAPYHPDRETYYTKKTTDFGFQPPQFDYKTPSNGKTVLSDFLEIYLDYTFQIIESI